MSEFLTLEQIRAKNAAQDQALQEKMLLGQLKGTQQQDTSPYFAASNIAKPTMAEKTEFNKAGLANALTQGATAGAMTGNPYMAAAAVGGSLLSQAMANEAQAKQAQRQRAMQIAQEQGQGEQRAFQMLMEAYKGALR